MNLVNGFTCSTACFYVGHMSNPKCVWLKNIFVLNKLFQPDHTIWTCVHRNIFLVSLITWKVSQQAGERDELWLLFFISLQQRSWYPALQIYATFYFKISIRKSCFNVKNANLWSVLSELRSALSNRFRWWKGKRAYSAIPIIICVQCLWRLLCCQLWGTYSWGLKAIYT